jgi:hypothetical protein
VREKRKQEESDGDLGNIPLFLSIMYNTMFHASYLTKVFLPSYGLGKNLYH